MISTFHKTSLLKHSKFKKGHNLVKTHIRVNKTGMSSQKMMLNKKALIVYHTYFVSL